MKRWAVIRAGGPRYGPPDPPTLLAPRVNRGAPRSPPPSALLLSGRLRCEVVVVGHAAGDVGVEVPLDRACRESLLRLDDLLKQRVVGGLLVGHLIVDLELLLQHGIRRLVEADLVLRLQLDVVLRVAIDRLP